MVHAYAVIRIAALALATSGLAAGCAGGSAAPAGVGAANGTAGTPAATTPAGSASCSGGLTGTEPGVVRITCGGTATVHIQAGDVTRDIPGGVCHSTADAWSASVGVIIDVTGVHGTYTGPAVDNVTVNDTSTPGSTRRGTIQATVGGKLYYDLGNATMTISADRQSAHLEGTSEKTSDAPGAKLTVSVTC